MDYFIYRVDELGFEALHAATLSDHLAFAKTMGGRVKYAGLTLASDEETMNGSIWELEASSLEEADRITAQDPYEKVDLFESKVIHPILQVVPGLEDETS